MLIRPMTNDFDPQDLTNDELAARVQHLEQALTYLQEQVRPQKPLPPVQVFAADDDTDWLLDTIKHLFTEHNSASINYTLEQLGQRLKLAGCSLWLWEQRSHELECAGAWQASNLVNLQEHFWPDELLPVDSTELAELLRGQNLSLDASYLSRTSLAVAGVRQLTLVPVQDRKSVV